jgi:hypothetical protein
MLGNRFPVIISGSSEENRGLGRTRALAKACINFFHPDIEIIRLVPGPLQKMKGAHE